MLIDDEKAWEIGASVERGKAVLQFRPLAGEEFTIVRPAMSEETEHILLQQIREIVAEDGQL